MNVGMNLALILALALAAIGISTRSQASVSNRAAAVPGSNLNHNETLVRDMTPIQQADDSSLWMSIEQAFARVMAFIPAPIYQSSIGCNRWGCGQNHNETLVRDTTPIQRADDSSLWMSIEQAFARALAFIPSPIYHPSAIGPCGRWGCGQNHNETLVRDATPIQRADDWRHHSSDKNSQVGKGGLPPLKLHGRSNLHSRFKV